MPIETQVLTSLIFRITPICTHSENEKWKKMKNSCFRPFLGAQNKEPRPPGSASSVFAMTDPNDCAGFFLFTVSGSPGTDASPSFVISSRVDARGVQGFGGSSLPLHGAVQSTAKTQTKVLFFFWSSFFWRPPP